MGACAIQKDFGISAVFQNDGEVQQAMLNNAGKIFALGNSTKLNATEHYKVCDLNDINGLITELPTNDARLDEFRKSGLRLF